MCVCVFYTFPQLFIQLEHKLAYWCCYKYFQFEVRGEMISSYNFLLSILSVRVAR